MNQKVTKREKLCYVLTNIGNVPVQAILGSYLLIFLYEYCGIESGILCDTVSYCTYFRWFK